MEKLKSNHPFMYVVGSNASGLLFNPDLLDNSIFNPINKFEIFPKNLHKIFLMSYSGLAEDEDNEIYQWGETDYDENKKVSKFYD